MKVKEATFTKELKMGLPQYSNVTAGLSVTVEVKEGEKLNEEAIWDYLNREVLNHTDVDPSWIKKEELKDYWKFTIKVPKGGDEQ